MPTDAEVERAMGTRRRRRRAVALGVSLLAFLGAGAYAVPVTRAGLGDVLGSFSGWVAGDDAQAPGREAAAPDWLEESAGATRLLAEAEGVRLLARRVDGRLAFELNGSVGIDDTLDGWRRQLADNAVVVLGTTGFGDEPFDARKRRPLYGATAQHVERVELRVCVRASGCAPGQLVP